MGSCANHNINNKIYNKKGRRRKPQYIILSFCFASPTHVCCYVHGIRMDNNKVDPFCQRLLHQCASQMVIDPPYERGVWIVEALGTHGLDTGRIAVTFISMDDVTTRLEMFGRIADDLSSYDPNTELFLYTERIVSKRMMNDPNCSGGAAWCSLRIGRPTHLVNTTMKVYDGTGPCRRCASLSCETPYVARKLKICAGCNVVRYCSRECQITDWKLRHKANCKVLGVEEKLARLNTN